MNEPSDWKEIVGTALRVFVIAFVGCVAAFALWVRDLDAPGVTVLGSGDRLSVLVTDGSARLVLATGDDPIGYENALSRVRPVFARRVDVLLLAGTGRSLLVPVAAHADRNVRISSALAALPRSAETDALGFVSAFSTDQRIELGPSVAVTVETLLPFGDDAADAFPAWRMTIERGETRVVVLSDGENAAIFPPGPPAAVIAVSGDDPLSGWESGRGVALIANASAIDGPDLREGAAASRNPPQWTARVFPGEALRLRFVPGGIELPPDIMQPVPNSPTAASSPGRIVAAKDAA